MKSKGTPEPMPVLVERALKDIVENKVTIAEIMANKPAAEPVAEEVPAVVSVAGEGKVELAPVSALPLPTISQPSMVPCPFSRA